MSRHYAGWDPHKDKMVSQAIVNSMVDDYKMMQETRTPATTRWSFDKVSGLWSYLRNQDVIIHVRDEGKPYEFQMFPLGDARLELEQGRASIQPDRHVPERSIPLEGITAIEFRGVGGLARITAETKEETDALREEIMKDVNARFGRPRRQLECTYR